MGEGLRRFLLRVNGRIVTKVVSVFGEPIDYSPMK